MYICYRINFSVCLLTFQTITETPSVLHESATDCICAALCRAEVCKTNLILLIIKMDKYFALMHWLPLNMIEINLFKKIFKTEYQFIIGAINQTQDFDLITTFNCGLFYI